MQISIFDGQKPLKVTKPIRLIELFAGYGSQAFALKYLGVKFESWKICEWAIKSIQAYKDAHCSDDTTDYSKDLTKNQLIEYLANKGVSSNYNEPMTFEKVKRLGEDKLRTIYNNIQATHNLVNIQQAKGEDLGITDTDNYCYVMTYSFPCQDLSLAGKQAGMEKGTRSGMLWEVERILDELDGNLPQVLLMENVPEVIGSKNIKHFAKWLKKLESLGYKCYWQVLNAKDYGVPQNRERCFMVSILGDYYYEFPKKIKLEHKLKDMLEENVNKKYYLSQKMIDYCTGKNQKESKFPRGERFVQSLKMTNNKGIATTISTNAGNRPVDNFVLGCEIRTDEGIRTFNDNLMGALRTIDACGSKHIIEFGSYYTWKNKKGEINTQCNRANNPNNCALTIACSNVGKVLITSKNKRIKTCAEKLNPTIDGQFMDIFNQKNREDDLSGCLLAEMDAHQGNIVYNNYRIRKLTPKECFRLMGVKDEDFEKIAKNQSDASLYHLAGDSIVVDVLMHIFNNLTKH